jgi:hypothetical protein
MLNATVGQKATPCQVRGCPRPRHPDDTRCQAHVQRFIKKGTEKGTGLSGPQRSSYVHSVLSVMRRRIRGRRWRHPIQRDAALIQLLYDLTCLLRHRIERTASVHDWAKYKPRKKAEAMLWHLYSKRWPNGEDCARVIVATVIGTLYALRLEPNIERGQVYQSFQIMRALAALMRPERIVSTSERNGVTHTLVLKESRPRPTGRYVVGHLHHLIVTPCLFYLREVGQEFETQVLQHMLQHPKPQRAIRITQSTKKKERHTQHGS